MKIRAIIPYLSLLFGLTACHLTDSVYQITPGMSYQEVIDAIGRPDHIVTVSDCEHWYYKPYLLGAEYQYLEVTFDNHRVSGYFNLGELTQRKRDLKGIPDYSVQDPYDRIPYAAARCESASCKTKAVLKVRKSIVYK